MGKDKACIEIDGVPLWRRQLRTLRDLGPRELFISGDPREDWSHEKCLIIADAKPNAGPLGGIVAALRHCSAPLLVTLAVDLPRMTSEYLAALVAACSDARGAIPSGEPLAAVYPITASAIAEQCLASGDYSMQHFARRCIAEGSTAERNIAAADEPLFLNMNTPEDLWAVTNA